ncbi:MAG: phenylacetate--CoA ligase family protein [Candidatus Latescibacteria bacterium]|nr:phenylacetate--CoA ligase family protein [Candidatus Latescibacterota bacterium]
MASYEELRTKHRAETKTLLPEYVERLSWSADRLHQEREEKLRLLIRRAKEQSPWHKKRLAHINPETMQEADLEHIPPMTKGDLMDNWDEIVTDRDLNLDLVNSHLESLTTDQYLLNEYHAVASGGSTGLRGVFVYDWTGWKVKFVGQARWHSGLRTAVQKSTEKPYVRATVFAGSATHLSSATGQSLTSGLVSLHRFPITLPLEQIVEGLNRVQPDDLAGYPSALYLLAHEAQVGRLRIAPSYVGTGAEPLLPEIRAALEKAWGVPVRNMWSCSEGAGAASCEEGQGMHLNDDLVIVEPVDVAGQLVPPGVASAKIYLTNLYNHALPLIRYELTDEVTLLEGPCPCGSSYRRIDDVQGRLDDVFTYACGTRIHPHVFRSALGRESTILEYQVRQTTGGAAISIRCSGAVDRASLRAKITAEMEGLGLAAPAVSIVQVDRFERLDTGKLKRFIVL